jgi:hypothetical protein
MEIRVWFGIGDGECIGPMLGEMVREKPLDGGLPQILITDKRWLDDLELDDPIEYRCERYEEGGWVRYDDYAWTRPGDPEPPHDTPWP